MVLPWTIVLLGGNVDYRTRPHILRTSDFGRWAEKTAGRVDLIRNGEEGPNLLERISPILASEMLRDVQTIH
jgi:hypothetical protein